MTSPDAGPQIADVRRALARPLWDMRTRLPFASRYLPAMTPAAQFKTRALLGESRRNRRVRSNRGAVQRLHDVRATGDRLGVRAGRGDDQRILPDPPQPEMSAM